MTQSATPEVSKQKLAADLKAVVADTEELLRATAGQAGEKVADLRTRIEARLGDARVTLAETQAAALEKAKQAGRVADDYVHENPWRSVGIAAGVGLLVGMLISRR